MTRTRLVVIPTYNEAENVERLASALLQLRTDCDLLFVDDSSPDGTAQVIAKLSSDSRVKLLVRPARMGIGSAHRDGILWGYAHGYEHVATMDADLTHSAQDVERLFAHADEADVIIASRFISPGSLPGWSYWRACLTKAGHLLTRTALDMPYDATGGLRLYSIKKIPRLIFERAAATGYFFLIEILLLLHVNGFTIRELPVILPARILGNSKMSLQEIRRSITLIFSYFLIRSFLPERLRLPSGSIVPEDEAKEFAAGTVWDSYWANRCTTANLFYDIIASWYRRLVIRPAFEHSLRREFAPSSLLLHAGCGGGQVDVNVVRDYRIIALDFSIRALELYSAVVGPVSEVKLGSLDNLPFPDNTFDGIYNLGVMEHFPAPVLPQVLNELRRVLKPEGKMILWWPPEWGATVLVLRVLRKIYCFVTKEKENDALFPDECSRIKSRAEIEKLFARCGLEVESFVFGIRDFFTQVEVVARRSDA